MAYVEMYQNSIIVLDEINKEWIEDTKAQNSDCDEFVVNYNYTLTWYELVSIDSVRYKQDFSNITESDILDLAENFMIRDVEIETYTVEVTDDEGNTTTETRKRAIITVDTKSLEEVFPDVNIVDEEDVLLAENIYSTMMDMNIEGNLYIYDEDIDLSNLKEYGEGSANLPYFNQTDSRWGYKSYGSSSIATAGCGPTSLAMVVSGLTGNRVEPDAVADWSLKNGHRAEGSGSYWSLMTAGGSNFGLNVESVSRKNPNAIVKALSEGKPVIASMGKGHFTNGGHFIVLRGITEDGKILVHDSASVNRSNQEWDLSIIINESSKNGGVNGSPFWIFSN